MVKTEANIVTEQWPKIDAAAIAQFNQTNYKVIFNLQSLQIRMVPFF